MANSERAVDVLAMEVRGLCGVLLTYEALRAALAKVSANELTPQDIKPGADGEIWFTVPVALSATLAAAREPWANERTRYLARLIKRAMDEVRQ